MTKKNLLPMRLQFFAESNDAGTTDTTNGEVSNNQEPTMDDLLSRIAELETASVQKDAEIMKWKNSSDKASSQSAEYKRQLTARMTAQEQQEQAKREEEESMKNELSSLRGKLRHIEATKRYMKLGFSEELAEATATAEIAGDMDGVSKNYATHIESVRVAEYQKFLKERPEINAGHTGEDIDKTIEVAKNLSKQVSKTTNKDILKNYL